MPNPNPYFVFVITNYPHIIERTRTYQRPNQVQQTTELFHEQENVRFPFFLVSKPTALSQSNADTWCTSSCWKNRR